MPDRKVKRLRMDGMISDLPDTHVPEDYWTRVINAYSRHGVTETALSDSDAADTWTGQTSGDQFEYGLYAPDNAANYWIFSGFNGANGVVRVTDQSSFKDITPTNWVKVGHNLITGGVINGYAFLNNGGNLPSGTDQPVYWDRNFTTPNIMAVLPGWFGATEYCAALRPFRDFLIGMNFTDTSTPAYFPDQVRWSDRAAAGGVPTAWTPTATNEAGDLTVGTGALIDGQEMRDGFMMFSANSAWYMQEIGLPRVMGVRKAFDSIGVLARNCIQPWFDGTQIVVTQGDIIQHDGRRSKSIANRQVRKEMFGTMTQETAAVTHTVIDQQNRELWVCWNDNNTGGGAPDRALIWNGSRWAQRDLPNRAAITGVASITPGFIDGSHEPALIAEAETGNTVDRLLLIEGDVNDPGQGKAFTRSGVIFAPGQQVTVKRVWPIGEGMSDELGDIVGVLSGTLFVASRRSPQDEYVESEVLGYSYPDDSTGSITVGAVGHDFRFHFSASNDRYFRLYGFDIEYEIAGAPYV